MLVQISVQDGQAIICIADDGVGILPELAEHIFEPFVVGDESRNSKQGTGLGLAVGKKIVQAHGGEICLKEAEKRWSTWFEITLALTNTSNN